MDPAFLDRSRAGYIPKGKQSSVYGLVSVCGNPQKVNPHQHKLFVSLGSKKAQMRISIEAMSQICRSDDVCLLARLMHDGRELMCIKLRHTTAMKETRH